MVSVDDAVPTSGTADGGLRASCSDCCPRTHHRKQIQRSRSAWARGAQRSCVFNGGFQRAGRGEVHGTAGDLQADPWDEPGLRKPLFPVNILDSRDTIQGRNHVRRLPLSGASAWRRAWPTAIRCPEHLSGSCWPRWSPVFCANHRSAAPSCPRGHTPLRACLPGDRGVVA